MKKEVTKMYSKQNSSRLGCDAMQPGENFSSNYQHFQGKMRAGLTFGVKSRHSP
jgi:hypothetical protein